MNMRTTQDQQSYIRLAAGASWELWFNLNATCAPGSAGDQKIERRATKYGMSLAKVPASRLKDVFLAYPLLKEGTEPS